MNRDIMCKEDVLSSDNVGSAMLNLTNIMDDIEGLKAMLEPFVECNEHELLPHIVRSLETFTDDINDVYEYLDLICLNSSDQSIPKASASTLINAGAVCDTCEKALTAEDQESLGAECKACPMNRYIEGRC